MFRKFDVKVMISAVLCAPILYIYYPRRLITVQRQNEEQDALYHSLSLNGRRLCENITGHGMNKAIEPNNSMVAKRTELACYQFTQTGLTKKMDKGVLIQGSLCKTWVSLLILIFTLFPGFDVSLFLNSIACLRTSHSQPIMTGPYAGST